MTKIDRIVPETKIRLTKNLIKSTIRTFEDQTINDVNDFSVSMNSILAKGLDLFFNDNIQRMYEKRQYQKNNYSIEDDLFLIEIKKFMRNKIPEIYDIYQNMRLESLADSFQDSEEKNANKINESTKNLFTNDFDAITDEKNNDREISKGIKKILNEKTKILDETEENKKSNDLISTLEEDKTILEKNEEFHEKIKNNINNISLSNLINLYSQELCKQQKINSKMILQIQEKMENEKKIQNIFDVEECTYDDMLADLRYFTKEEINYLTLLENKQQNSHLNKDSPTKVFFLLL